MSIPKLTRMTGLFLGSALACTVARAQTNFLFNSLGGRPEGSDSVGAVGPIGESFSTTASPLDLVDVVLGLTDGGLTGSGSTTVSLFSSGTSIGGPAPSALLATLGTVSDSLLTSGYADYTIPVGSPYLLAPDTRYWIVLSTPNSSVAQWTYTASDSGPGVSTEYFNNSSGTSSTAAGPYSMAVAVSSVPEPSSLALLAGGFALVFHFTRRSRSAG